MLAKDLVNEAGELDPTWAPWYFAVADEHLFPLTWPHLLALLLHEDSSYCPWDEVAGVSSERETIMGALRTREWDGLDATERLDVLCWLAENTAQCQTVRTHLERNYDTSMEARRERKNQIDEEATREAELKGCMLRIDGMQSRLDEYATPASNP